MTEIRYISAFIFAKIILAQKVTSLVRHHEARAHFVKLNVLFKTF